MLIIPVVARQNPKKLITGLRILTSTLGGKYTRCIQVFYLYVSRGCDAAKSVYDGCFLLTLGISPSTEFAQIIDSDSHDRGLVWKPLTSCRSSLYSASQVSWKQI